MAIVPEKVEPPDRVGDVAASYDVVADAFYQHFRTEPAVVVMRYESLFLDQIPSGGRVLELGCGNGLPVTAKLAEKFAVTAVDVSRTQIEKARQNVPGPRYLHADMSTLEFDEAKFDGVVAFYSIFHVPRGHHAELFRSIYSWLKPGGLFVATLGSSGVETQLVEDWLGAPMYWSSFDADTYREMIAKTGFVVESDRVEASDNPESDVDKKIHLWIVARKPN